MITVKVICLCIHALSFTKPWDMTGQWRTELQLLVLKSTFLQVTGLYKAPYACMHPLSYRVCTTISKAVKYQRACSTQHQDTESARELLNLDQNNAREQRKQVIYWSNFLCGRETDSGRLFNNNRNKPSQQRTPFNEHTVVFVEVFPYHLQLFRLVCHPSNTFIVFTHKVQDKSSRIMAIRQ